MNATSTTSLPDSCPAPAELHSFALGKLPVATHERLASHVEACSRCQTALESTTLRGDSLLADIDRAAKLDTSPHEVRTPPTTGTLGGYEIVRELGRGGMGVVYLVRQPGADRLVALKQLRSDALLGSTLEEREEVLERFRSEARAAGRLTHDHLVPVYEVGEAGGRPYYTMRYLEGGSLAGVMRDTGPLPPRRAAAHVETVAHAVQYAHEQGVLHRDLKPHNILIGSDGRPAVADFGLAKRLDGSEALTQSGRALGTLGYAAPEQVSDASRVGVACDVYGLGATLYALLTGRPPFQAASDADVLDQVRWHEPVSPRQLNPAVPLDLETICLRCLNKEPTRRYKSAGDLAEDLRRFLAGETILARRTGVAEKVWRWTRRQPALAGALAAAVVGLVTTTVVSILFLAEKSARLELRSRAVRDREEDAKRLTRLAEERLEYAESSRKLRRMSFDLLALKTFADGPLQRNKLPNDGGLSLRIEALKKLVGDRALGETLETLADELARLGELSPRDPEVLRDSQILAFHCSVLGRQAQEKGKREEAERIFRIAVSAWERRLRAVPEDSDAANELTNCLYFQGVLARDQSKKAEQEAAWKRAAEVCEKIADKSPEFAANLGRTYYNLGVSACTPYRPDEVISWQTKAIETLAPLRRKSPDRTDWAWFLAEAHVGRGIAWQDKGEVAKALPDLRSAAEFAKGTRRTQIEKHIKTLPGATE